MASPPDAAPRWWKGNLHTHSLWSDGNDYPEMIVDWYVKKGYQFLALSDHNVLSRGQRWVDIEAANKRAKVDAFALYRGRFGPDWVETRDHDGKKQVRLKPLSEFRPLFEQPGKFLLIQGEEITDQHDSKPIHMNATNLVDTIPPQGGKSVVEAMTNNLLAVEAHVKKFGVPVLTHLNHPNFGYAITAEELAMVTRELYFEVYNGHPDVHQIGDETHVGIERMWDIVNTIRIAEMRVAPVAGLATDDSHHYFAPSGNSTPGRGWIMVRSRFLTPESLIRAIESGDFYASTGVTLAEVKFSPASKLLEVEVAPEPGVEYTIRFIGTKKGYDPSRKPVLDASGKPLPVTRRYSDDVGRIFSSSKGTKATYRLTGDEYYVRAVVTSDRAPENPSYPGQKSQAWTQPVGWESLIEPNVAPDPSAKASPN
ncbi:PHP domain-containing protein [Singulisphaera sp. PoT]|uniref:PHP domain-containing protein n=1 Tax=Singulisphaera sp. PoT TaxID=3411797 RepID=UPI003BF4E810